MNKFKNFILFKTYIIYKSLIFIYLNITENLLNIFFKKSKALTYQILLKIIVRFFCNPNSMNVRR